MTTLVRILETYEELSGQKINTQKSTVTFSAKTPPEVRTRVKATLSIDKKGGIGKYIGLPENFGRKKSDIFASIVDRIRQKSHSWMTRFLFGAGKQIMLKAVLSAMPCYTMSCFKLPLSLCKQIQSLLTRFWWDANPEKRKMCWVAWSVLTLPKHAGGLGFRDIEAFNNALLAKIGWRILKEPQSLLARVLLRKYARDVSFLHCTVPTTASHGWQSIMAGRDTLLRGLSWVVGNEEATRVWGDPWLSFKSPSKSIGPPNLEAINLRVSDLLCPLTNQWDLDKIILHLPQYEDTILRIITSSAPSLDTLVWLPEKQGVYSTKTGYGLEVMEKNGNDRDDHQLDWLKHIWNVATSPKLKDFLWKIIKKAIPVSDNLCKRGIQPFNCKRCGAYEDDLHVFLTCPFAEEVWNLLPLRSRPSPVTPSMTALIKAGSDFTPLPPSGISTPIWPWVLWNLWKSRNKFMFENRAFTVQETVLKCILDAKEWSTAHNTPQHGLARPMPSSSVRLSHPPSLSPEILVCSVDAAWSAETRRCGVGGVFSGNNHLSLHRPLVNQETQYHQLLWQKSLLSVSLSLQQST